MNSSDSVGPSATPAAGHDDESRARGRHAARRNHRIYVVAVTLTAVMGIALGGWALFGPSGQPPGAGAAPLASNSADSTANADDVPGAQPVASATPDPRAPGELAPSAPPLGPAQPTMILGDSLGLVVYPYLADLLPDRYVSYVAEVGRTTAGTLRALQSTAPQDIPPVVIISTGTNDPTVGEFRTALTQILDLLGPGRCVVLNDIVRPDAFGAKDTDMNAALTDVVAAHPNARVLQWTTLLRENPKWLSRDGIHPREAGAIGRAEAFAAAAAQCSAVDPAAPRAPRQTLPIEMFFGPISGGGANGSSGSNDSGSNAGNGSGAGGSGSDSGGSSGGGSGAATQDPTPVDSTGSDSAPVSTLDPTATKQPETQPSTTPTPTTSSPKPTESKTPTAAPSPSKETPKEPVATKAAPAPTS